MPADRRHPVAPRHSRLRTPATAPTTPQTRRSPAQTWCGSLFFCFLSLLFSLDLLSSSLFLLLAYHACVARSLTLQHSNIQRFDVRCLRPLPPVCVHTHLPCTQLQQRWQMRRPMSCLHVRLQQHFCSVPCIFGPLPVTACPPCSTPITSAPFHRHVRRRLQHPHLLAPLNPGSYAQVKAGQCCSPATQTGDANNPYGYCQVKAFR